MKQTLALWSGVLTGPIVWFLSLEAKFALSPWVCAWQWKPAVYVVSLLAFVLIAVAGFISWFEWRHLSAHGPDETVRMGAPQALALGGMLLNAGFFIVLIAQSLPELLMNGCES